MLRQAQKITLKYFQRKNRLISFSQPPASGNVSADRCVGVSALIKHHQLRGDLRVLIAVSNRSLTSPDADTPTRLHRRLAHARRYTSTNSHMGKILVYRLAYNRDVAAGQLAVFQGGPSRTGSNEAPIQHYFAPAIWCFGRRHINGAGRVERAMQKNSQLATSRLWWNP